MSLEPDALYMAKHEVTTSRPGKFYPAAVDSTLDHEHERARDYG